MTGHKLVGIAVRGEEEEPQPWHSNLRYGPWEIYLTQPYWTPDSRWTWHHKDFDGAEDADDGRHGFAPSLCAAMDAIDDYEACS